MAGQNNDVSNEIMPLSMVFAVEAQLDEIIQTEDGLELNVIEYGTSKTSNSQ